MTCDVSRRYRRSRVADRNERQNDEEARRGGGPAGCGVAGWLPWGGLGRSGDGPRMGADRGRPVRNRCRAAAAPGRRGAQPGGGPARLLLLLVRRPWWLLGIGVELGGFATHAVALRTGPLTIVQMLVASSLLFSVATVRLWSDRRRSWTAWAAVLAVIVGIASFVALASPAGSDAGVPGDARACRAGRRVPGHLRGALAAAGLAAAGSAARFCWPWPPGWPTPQ